MTNCSRDVLQSSHILPAVVPRTRSKLAEVEEHLLEMFQKQQRSFEIPQRPVKLEKQQEVPVQQRAPRKDPQCQLTRKNMEIFQQIQKDKEKGKERDTEKENKVQNNAEPAIVQLDGHPARKGYRNQEAEVAKLKNTIATYEMSTNSLMQALNSERESYKVTTHELRAANEQLKGEVTRIERLFRDVVGKREDELRMTNFVRKEKDDLLTQNLRLQHDLAHALDALEKSERRCQDHLQTVNCVNADKNKLSHQCKDLQVQLERMRSTMSAWCQNSETAPDRSVGHIVTCAVTKIVFCGSVIAVVLAAILNAVQASPDVECDYVLEALDD